MSKPHSMVISTLRLAFSQARIAVPRARRVVGYLGKVTKTHFAKS